MHSLTLNTKATVRNAEQLVRPDQIKYSSIASVNYRRDHFRKVWQCDDSARKISNIITVLLFPFCNRIRKHTSLQ